MNKNTKKKRCRELGLTRLDFLEETAGPECVVIGSEGEKEFLASAIVGVDANSECAVYDFDELVHAFMIFSDWTEEDAIEWVEYNVIRSLPYYERAPIVVRRFPEILVPLETPISKTTRKPTKKAKKRT